MMSNVLLLCFVLAAHTIADFCFQTDWMAQNKSSSNQALGAHIAVYSFCMFFIVGSLALFGPWTFGTVLLFTVVNGIAHFITDYITSRLTTYYWLREKRHEFFVVIGFDQLAHNIVLLLTFVWLFVS